jgi:hypothetical protein
METRMARPVRDSSPRRALGYVRVSELGGRSGPELHTIDVQRAAIERAAIERAALGGGLELVDVLVEVNRSGADADRPLFSRGDAAGGGGDVACLIGCTGGGAGAYTAHKPLAIGGASHAARLCECAPELGPAKA